MCTKINRYNVFYAMLISVTVSTLSAAASSENVDWNNPAYRQKQRDLAEKVSAKNTEHELDQHIAPHKVRLVNATDDVIAVPYHVAQETSEFWHQDGPWDEGVFIMFKPNQAYDVALAGRNAKEQIKSAKLFGATVYGGHRYLLHKQANNRIGIELKVGIECVLYS